MQMKKLKEKGKMEEEYKPDSEKIKDKIKAGVKIIWFTFLIFVAITSLRMCA